MSFTTRCPACGTMFRVVPDQLKISDGWVRCGHCSDVFDAMLNLQSETAPGTPSGAQPPSQPSAPGPGASRVVIRRVPAYAPPPPVPPPQPFQGFVHRAAPVAPAAPDPAPVMAPLPPATYTPNPPVDPGWGFPSQFEEPEDSGPPSVSGADGAWDGDWLLAPQPPEAVLNGLKNPAPPAVSEEFVQELARFNALHATEATEATEALQTPGFSEAIEENAKPQTPDEVTPEQINVVEADPDDDVPGFVVQGRRDAFWRSPMMRSGLMLMAVVLIGLLALQWAVHERDQLAARHPEAMPVLQTLCEVAGCSLAAPRRIDAVAIDSSTLVRKLGQFYAFDLVLKNSEAMAVAMPALELSLTDGRDKEIARRVFLPEEMPGRPALVPANGSLSVNMRLSLSEAELSTMAGYRALVFYP